MAVDKAQSYKAIIGTFLVNKLRKELIAQDHVASGKLLESIKVTVTKTVNEIVVQGKFEKYGIYVNQGVGKNKAWVPIDDLVRWIRVKGIDLRGRSEEQVAWAIRIAIWNRGIPTNGDERKKRWMTKTIEKNTPQLLKIIKDRTVFILQAEVRDMVARTNKLMQVS